VPPFSSNRADVSEGHIVAMFSIKDYDKQYYNMRATISASALQMAVMHS
jgi:hypothetical protein